MNTTLSILSDLSAGHYKTLARVLTLVENDIEPATQILREINSVSNVPVIGITGPPGAGKSTLVNGIITMLSAQDKKIAVLAIDPTSPFNYGSLLGDRIRMSGQFNNPNVFIRSLATRGALGGISAKTIEMVEVLKSAGFDLIVVETVGVGQSEVEIAGLADKTIVVLVPESGDEIQNIKSGMMEIADCFVINKADREGADRFAGNLQKIVHQGNKNIPVLKTIAEQQVGLAALCDWIIAPLNHHKTRQIHLLAEKTWRIIQQRKMQQIDRQILLQKLESALNQPGFNLYQFAEQFL